jgi:hypothetical protein
VLADQGESRVLLKFLLAAARQAGDAPRAAELEARLAELRRDELF